MLPSSVESNVEQYLTYTRGTPCPASHSRTASDADTASATGAVRVFNATTTASHSGSGASAPGGPNSSAVRAPARRSAAATSVPPV